LEGRSRSQLISSKITVTVPVSGGGWVTRTDTILHYEFQKILRHTELPWQVGDSSAKCLTTTDGPATPTFCINVERTYSGRFVKKTPRVRDMKIGSVVSAMSPFQMTHARRMVLVLFDTILCTMPTNEC
jgi:hypothetical protein